MSKAVNFRNGVASFGIPLLGNSHPIIWGTAYFVDGTNGNDGYNGKRKDRAFATVQKAFNTVSDRDIVYVSDGSYSEALTTPQYGGAKNVTIIGSNNTRGDQCTLIHSSNATVLDVRAPGWRFSGFRIVGGTNAAVELNMDAASPTAGDDWAPYTQIDNCLFFSGTTQIDFVGAPYSCYIIDNTFEVGTTAIICSGSPIANINRSIVAGNFFNNLTNGINMNPRGFNNSWIVNNAFNDAMTIYIDNRGGSQGRNIISGNYLGGTYSNAGGYYGHADDMWGGNFNTIAGGLTAANPA